ncbi:TPA: N-acylglucosamine 2-epimerase [Candidatus Poribacteria bacterium]|nr:N-acylglucosamine 2-epimerase [Candidatus Poribacteria bacterium]
MQLIWTLSLFFNLLRKVSLLMKRNILIKYQICILIFFIMIINLNAEETQPSEQLDPIQVLTGIKNELERVLKENIITFWYPQTIDKENGGYNLNHDIKGKWLGPSDKYIVTQARMVWFFSHLARSKYGTKEHLESAKHGYEFLRDKMWDKQYGGFYWAVDWTGSKATVPQKHLYGQSFGLYALSEYAMASGDIEALYLAKKLFSVIEFIAHDSIYGGYKEYFLRDWSLPKQDDTGPMGNSINIKLMNTHLHLLEAMTTYYQATKDPVARERLIELIFIQSNSVVRKTIGACTDKYQLDWKPIHSPEFDRVSYGHDLENVWLLISACEAVGINNRLLFDLYRTLFDYSLKYGYDSTYGGFYESGPFSGKADKRSKVWWVQAECLVSALDMYCLTGDIVYFDCFNRTLNWIMKRQIDWINGDWYSEISESGEPSGEKAGAWKSAYHNGRAIMKCIEFMEELISGKIR